MSELSEIKKILKEHGKRLSKLESMINLSSKSIIPSTSKKSLTSMFVDLKNEKFFNQPRSLNEIVERLAQSGHHYPYRSLSSPLQRAVRQKILGRIKKDNKWAYVKR